MAHEYNIQNIRITRLTRHADTFKKAIFVQASAFVEAGIAVTLVDVVLTPEIHSGYDWIT